MTGNPWWQAIPTKLGETQFEEFFLPHLSRGRRGPLPTLSLHMQYQQYPLTYVSLDLSRLGYCRYPLTSPTNLADHVHDMSRTAISRFLRAAPHDAPPRVGQR
ncbi:hypothetical protein PQR07_39740, partial [Paraburkholderia aspalathi]